MPFDWKEYLLLARAIYNKKDQLGNEEAVRRCAVSRAYYSAFCGCRNFAKDHLQYTPSYSAEDQKNIREHFQSKGSNDVASKLYELVKWRRQCDYDDIVININFVYSSAIARAIQIFQHLDKMLAP